MSFFKNWFFPENEENYTIDGCKSAQKVVSKYGYTIVCPEDQEEIKVSSDPYCAEAQKIATKYGYNMTCPE